MKVIKSIATTDATLVYSNVEENEHPQWVAGTAYAIADSVIYDHKVYEAVVAVNGSIPPELDPEHWYAKGSTNRFSMFDGIISNYTTNSRLIHVTLRPMDVVDGLVLLNLNCVSVRVVITDPVTGLLYDKVQYLTDLTAVTDYFTYFLAPVQSVNPNAMFLDLPVSPTANIDIYIDNGTGVAQVGEIVYGQMKVVGRTNYGTSIGIKSYSRKETDEFGTTTVVKRKNSKYADYDIDIDNVNLSDVQRFFADIDSVPCMFIGHEDMDELVVYGFYSDFKVTINFVTVSKCTLRVEGLV